VKITICYTGCIALLLMVIFACDRVRPEAPEPITLDSTLVIPLSTVNIPIRYHVDSLENTINSKVKGTFLKQWVQVNEQGDSLYIELSKKSKIEIEWRNTTLLYNFPLHIEGKFIKHLGKKIKLKNEVPVTMDLRLHLTTALSFNPNWTLKPQTTLHYIEWIKEPTLKVAFLNINLRKKVEQALKAERENLTGIVDKELKKLLDARKVMQKLWLDIQNLIVVNRKKTTVWLKPQGENLSVSLMQDGQYLGLDVELKTRIKTVLEGETIPASTAILPAYKPLVAKNDSLKLFVLVTVDFDRINKSLNKELAGKKIEQQGYSTTLRKIEAYGTASGLALRLDLRGDASGTVYVRGTPVFDSVLSVLKIKDFGFDIDSEDAVVRSADWLLHDDALKLIKDKLSLDLQPLISKLPDLIMAGIEKGKSGKKMELFITNLQVKPQTILITTNNIQIILEAKGKAVIGLQKEVFAKKKKEKVR